MKNQYDDLKKEFQDTVTELSKITGWPQEQSKHVLELLASFTAKKAVRRLKKSVSSGNMPKWTPQRIC